MTIKDDSQYPVLTGLINQVQDLNEIVEPMAVSTQLIADLSDKIIEGDSTKKDLENVIATANTTTYATKGEINSVNSAMADKLNKGQVSAVDIDKTRGKFDQTYMTDEFLQQMAGNTPINATPADYSLVPKKFAFPVVKGIASKNLFDKSTTIPNSYLNTNGVVATMAGWYVSDLIPVQPNTAYYKNTYHYVAFYDANKNFISVSTNGVFAITTPVNCAYIRLNIASGQTVTIDTAQLELGTTGTSYESYDAKLNTSTIKDFSNAVDEKLKKVMPKTIPNKNKFLKTTVTKGYYVSDTTGILNAAAGYNTSDWIDVDPSTNYYKNTFEQIAFYDENKKYISGYANANYSFVTPSNAKYVRLTVKDADLESAQLEPGNVATSYQTGLPLIKKEQIIDLSTGSGLGSNVVVVAKSNGDYNTIKAAVNAITDSSPTKRYTILIMPGVYEEDVSTYDKYIDLVALNPGSVFLINKTGNYYTPPLEMSCRNNLKNMIIIASEENKPADYTGEPAYAIHHDYEGEGENYIDNCKLISYSSNPMGIGTHQNQKIIMKNTEMISYVASRPALLFHPKVTTATGQKLTLDNCKLRSPGYSAIAIIDSNNNGHPGSTGDNRDTVVACYNNMFWADLNGKNDIIYKPTGAMTTGAIDGYIMLSQDSYGNNASQLNA